MENDVPIDDPGGSMIPNLSFQSGPAVAEGGTNAFGDFNAFNNTNSQSEQNSTLETIAVIAAIALAGWYIYKKK